MKLKWMNEWMKLLRRKEKNAKSTQREEDVIFYIGDIFSMPLSKSSILSEKFSSLLTTWGTNSVYVHDDMKKKKRWNFSEASKKKSQREGFYSCVMFLSFFYYYYCLFVCLVQCAMLCYTIRERTMPVLYLNENKKQQKTIIAVDLIIYIQK